jgi:molybdopterin synthase catalytic subunit
MIMVQESDFDVGAEYAALTTADHESGAVVMFTGRVRNFNVTSSVQNLKLEHYPGMTEKILQDIADEARQRWKILNMKIIHRIGALAPGDQIVFVGVTSLHRDDAFAAAEFLMDNLKTRAPFWKKELTAEGDVWVEARAKDEQAAQRWRKLI